MKIINNTNPVKPAKAAENASSKPPINKEK